MAIHNILNDAGEWLRGDGPHNQIVISSRVRLARNLQRFAFPGWAKKTERLQILDTIKPQVEALPEMADAHSVYSQDLTALEKQVLVERHLISREHAAKGVGSAVVMNRKQTLSIMPRAFRSPPISPVARSTAPGSAGRGHPPASTAATPWNSSGVAISPWTPRRGARKRKRLIRRTTTGTTPPCGNRARVQARASTPALIPPPMPMN